MLDVEFARGLLQRLHAAVNGHDAEALAALCSEDVSWQDPAAPHRLCGRDEVRWFHQRVMFPALPDVRVQLVDGPFLAPEGDSLAVRLRISGTMTGALTPPGFAPTGQRLVFETAEFSRFSQGLLVEHVVLLDMLDLARQIGAVPAADSAAGHVGIWLQHVAAFRRRAAASPSVARGWR